MSDLRKEQGELVQRAAELRRAAAAKAHPDRRRPGKLSVVDANKIETLSKEEEKVRDQYEKEVAEALAKNNETPNPAPSPEEEDDDDK